MSGLETHWSEQGTEMAGRKGQTLKPKLGPQTGEQKPGDSQETTVGVGGGEE